MIGNDSTVISVIMLTYNREKYVARAIQSVLGQTFRDFQFVIVDNGSTDGSGQICDDFAENDNRISVIHTARGSIGAGRNVGLANAIGGYITFVDDDDECEPEMLEYLLALMENADNTTAPPRCDISMCGSYRKENGVRSVKYVFDGIRDFYGVDCVKELLKRELYNSANPTKLFRRELFNGLRYDECGKYDDISMMYKLYAKARHVKISGRPLYTFYRHEGNNSGFITEKKKVTPEQLVEYFKAFSERTNYLSTVYPEERDFFRYQELSYMLSMYRVIEEYGLDECGRQKEYIIENIRQEGNNMYSYGLTKKEVLTTNLILRGIVHV